MKTSCYTSAQLTSFIEQALRDISMVILSIDLETKKVSLVNKLLEGCHDIQNNDSLSDIIEQF